MTVFGIDLVLSLGGLIAGLMVGLTGMGGAALLPAAVYFRHNVRLFSASIVRSRSRPAPVQDKSSLLRRLWRFE